MTGADHEPSPRPARPIGRRGAAPWRADHPDHRHRAARQAGTPAVRYRMPKDRRSSPQRWKDAAIELIELQVSYQDWLDSSPENLQDGATAEALAAVCGLDLSELEGVIPPRGFGRDCPAHPWSAHRGPRKPADGPVAPWTGRPASHPFGPPWYAFLAALRSIPSGRVRGGAVRSHPAPFPVSPLFDPGWRPGLMGRDALRPDAARRPRRAAEGKGGATWRRDRTRP